MREYLIRTAIFLAGLGLGTLAGAFFMSLFKASRVREPGEKPETEEGKEYGRYLAGLSNAELNTEIKKFRGKLVE
jgi:hypothetical protein